MWELDHKEGWGPKNWCFQTVVLEKTPESPLDNKEIKPISPKVNQSWIFIERTVAEAEAPVLWLPDGKSQLIGNDSDAGKDWRQKEKRATENEIFEGINETLKASLIQWSWIWANSRRLWRSGKPSVLQSMGSQRVRHNLTIRLSKSLV